MLFKEPVTMPDKEKMTGVVEKYIGAVECFCHGDKTAGFATLGHIAEFKVGKALALWLNSDKELIRLSTVSQRFSGAYETPVCFTVM